MADKPQPFAEPGLGPIATGKPVIEAGKTGMGVTGGFIAGTKSQQAVGQQQGDRPGLGRKRQWRLSRNEVLQFDPALPGSLQRRMTLSQVGFPQSLAGGAADADSGEGHAAGRDR
jgi:hypothetical protein